MTCWPLGMMCFPGSILALRLSVVSGPAGLPLQASLNLKSQRHVGRAQRARHNRAITVREEWLSLPRNLNPCASIFMAKITNPSIQFRSSITVRLNCWLTRSLELKKHGPKLGLLI